MFQNNFSWITFCKLFTVSKRLIGKQQMLQISYDKNKRQIILLYLTRATGKILKIAQVKPGEL